MDASQIRVDVFTNTVFPSMIQGPAIQVAKFHRTAKKKLFVVQEAGVWWLKMQCEVRFGQGDTIILGLQSRVP